MGCPVTQLLEVMDVLGKDLSCLRGQRGGASRAGFPALLGSGYQVSPGLHRHGLFYFALWSTQSQISKSPAHMPM